MISLRIAQWSLNKLERALLLAADEEEGPFRGDVIPV